MLINLINKFLIFLFVLASLNTTRHLYYFIQSIVKSNEEQLFKYKLNRESLIILGVSISYILTIVIRGFKF